MTLQNLNKILDKYEQQLGIARPPSLPQQLELLKGLPFYIDWQAAAPSVQKEAQKSSLSFNHVIGLPRKNGQELPLFDYERLLFNTLENHKHVWIKKATGLGITEFMLRYIAWLCVRDDSLRRQGAQMCIVTGPRIELAIGLIARLKGLFTNELHVTFDTKETVIELNGVNVEAYPSHHIDAMRGLPNVSFLFLDEADFFPPGQQAFLWPWIIHHSIPHGISKCVLDRAFCQLYVCHWNFVSRCYPSSNWPELLATFCRWIVGYSRGHHLSAP